MKIIYEEKYNDVFARFIDENGVQRNMQLGEQAVKMNDSERENLVFSLLEIIKEQNAKIILPDYQELRAKEYPPIQEQLDMIYWDKMNGTNNWEKTITAVKEKYPKT